jgi:hypothetical protein
MSLILLIGRTVLLILSGKSQAVPIKLFGGTEDADLSKRYQDMGVPRVVMDLGAGAGREDLSPCSTAGPS